MSPVQATPPGWEPARYARFRDERLQPARDLLHRVPLETVASIVDMGCGAGAVTAELRARHPGAEITGVDADAAMLEAAGRLGLAGVRWVQADLATWQPASAVQLLIANAALHWVHGHATLLPRLMAGVVRGGVMAVQVPVLADTPLQDAIEAAASDPRWASTLAPARVATEVRALAEYEEILAPHSTALALWDTTYLHPMPDAAAILDWVKASRLRPYLAVLLQAGLDPAPFERAVLAALEARFPRTRSGQVLLPFLRRFLVAVR